MAEVTVASRTRYTNYKEKNKTDGKDLLKCWCYTQVCIVLVFLRTVFVVIALRRAECLP